VKVPVIVTRPILLPLSSVNHSAPSKSLRRGRSPREWGIR
jgi:hypothetical protein